MLIEIHGAGFENKGAQLMLETVIQRVSERFPHVEFCLESGRDRPGHELRRLNLSTILCAAPRHHPRRHPYLLQASDLLGRLVPRFVVRPKHLVARHKIDALIDISGYAYGDKWAMWATRSFAERSRYFAKRGRPVVMLPQMLGPFSSPAFKTAMHDVCRNVDAIYARDRVSYEHVDTLFDRHCDKLHLSPDITIFAEPDDNTKTPAGRYACIIPNERVLKHGPAEWRDHYLDDLINAARLFNERGSAVLVVIHESAGGDFGLAKQIQRQAALPDEAICALSAPAQLKALLAGAFVVVTSRFHAAVGALSSAVPTIVLGWAHKYDMLMDDFGVGQYVHDASADWSSLHQKLLCLLDDETQRATRGSLQQRKEQMREQSERMWNKVFSILESKA